MSDQASKKPLHGGMLAAKALKEAGVEVIFTLSGGHIMPLYDGCIDEGIKIVDVRHEQAAVHAADSWARCNPGKIGVAAITAGPGVTDGVTGIANAWRANSPILIIGGQGPFENLRRGSLQEMDHLGVVRPITKFCDAIYQTKRIPEYIELAIRHAVSGIPGPSFLEIPMDIFMASLSEEEAKAVTIPRIRTNSPRLSPDRDEVRKAIDLLRNAERPMLMAGTSVKWSHAAGEMNRFIAETHIPTYTNGMARGSVSPDSPEFLNRSRRDALEKIDLIILAGTLLDFRMRFGQTIPADAKIIQLEMDATLIGQNRQADVPLVGNLACSFDGLLEEMKNRGVQLDFSPWRDELRAIENAAEAKVEANLNSDEVPIDPQRMCRELRDWLATVGEPIVIGDGGDIVATAAKILLVRSEGAWMDPGPLGTLGVGMPFALAGETGPPRPPGGDRVRRRLVRLQWDGIRHRGPLRPADHRHRQKRRRMGTDDATPGRDLRLGSAGGGAVESDPLRQGRRSVRRSRRVRHRARPIATGARARRRLRAAGTHQRRDPTGSRIRWRDLCLARRSG